MEAFLLLADLDLCFLLVVEARGGGVMTPLLPLLWLPLLLFLLELTRELDRLFEVTAEEEEEPLEPFRLGTNELDDVVGGFIIDLDLTSFGLSSSAPVALPPPPAAASMLLCCC